MLESLKIRGRVLAFFLITSSLLGEVGRNDVSKFLTVENDKGVRFSSLIADFSKYDLSENKKKTIQVTLLGCVKSPGVFVLNEDVTLQILLKGRPISSDEHLVFTVLSKIEVYRKGEKLLLNFEIDEERLFLLEDGDVVRLLAVLL